jgi:cell fate regulator YaaT (PSP1 superfamily)
MTPDSDSPPQAVCVQFRATGPLLACDAGGLLLAGGDRVVVDTDRGPELATVVLAAGAAADPSKRARVLRKADEQDLAHEDRSRSRETESHRTAVSLVRAKRLDMKLVKVEHSLDGGKATFFFFAERRVDFRELVRDLANRLRIRVEMRQIGARDETKLIGGMGPCGRELCCSSWLREFHAVSVKMAKEQDLSLNPSKLAGMCGRLKCCLRYEYDTYLQLKRELPRPGTHVVCVKGDGTVVRQQPIRQSVVVRRDDDGVEVEVTLEDLVQAKGSSGPEAP